MEQEEQDELEVQETTDTEETEQNDELSADAIAELKAKAEVSSQNFERAKKAEEELKALKLKAPSKENGLDNKDILYLAKADIHEDDMDEVLEYAKFKKLPVKEAHKLLEDMLSVRSEQRKTAQASNTGASQRGASKVDGSTLIQNASKGRLPEDDAGIEALVAAEMAQKTQK